MLLAPKDLYEKLEFDKIIELAARECMGELGYNELMAMKPSSDIALIDKGLREVREFKMSIHKNDRFPVYNYIEISDDLKMLDIEGYVLVVEGLQRINVVLLFIRDIFRFFTVPRREIYPNLYEIVKQFKFDEDLQKAIDRVIDDKGLIRSTASPDLEKIRRTITGKQRDLDKVFRGIVGELRQKGLLTDMVETFRNGRRVLSVPSEHKRKIRGIIHDESATGRTTYIEPEGVIEINNDIFDFEQEERREINRILRDLSAQLRPYTDILRMYQSLAQRFDVVQAKAHLAVKINGNMPILKPNPMFMIKKGVHPLLFLKNEQNRKKVVSFDMTMLHENRILVISGPNAGGKSITMKAIGLMQVMLQCGMLVPMSELSEMGVFENIFADIGDQQSLEDELSTYSSRLQNMKLFLDNANDKTLVLIDEFGSGTDPVIGGAIAESILHEFNARQTFGVITTHFSNLKVYAFKTKGVLNACMLFDADTLSPTYELKIGRPGSSYAFEIAEKSGLSKKVLDYAKHKTGKNEKAVDELLVDLQRDMQETQEKLKLVEDKEKQLDKLIKNYDELQKDFEYKRKRLKLDIKEAELTKLADDNRELEKLVREIRQEQNLERAKELASERKKERETIVKKVEEIYSEIYEMPNEGRKTVVQKSTFEAGDNVRIKNGGALGIIESVQKNNAVVMIGDMRMQLKINDLVHVAEQLEIIKKPRVTTDFVSQTASFESKIDLRGMRMMDAMLTLQTYLDKALMTSTPTVQILHGKGDGILRQAVKKKLREYKGFKNIRHPEANEGGDGITMADM